MSDSLVLVTGAAGTHGGSGPYVVRHLRHLGARVRAMVRRRDARATALEDLGAEVVEGDFFDIVSLASASAGVSAVYFCYPVRPRMVEAAVNLAYVCREQGAAIVDLSMIPARADHPSPAARQHWQVESVLDWTGLDVTHLRAGFFYENLVRFAVNSIAHDEALYLPFGDGSTRMGWVAAEDVAKTAAHVLVRPHRHAGQTYVLTGPDASDFVEVAETMGRALGRKVRYVDIPLETWRAEHLAVAERKNEFAITHLGILAQAMRSGVGFGRTTTHVQEVIGAPPQSLESFVSARAGAFLTGPSVTNAEGTQTPGEEPCRRPDST